MVSDDAKAVIALTTRLGDARRPSLSPTRWHRMASLLGDAGLAPSDVFAVEFDPRDLTGLPEDMATAVAELLGSAAEATVAVSDLGRMGVWTLTIVDHDYPDVLYTRLGQNAPPVIFGAGNRELLGGGGVGIVGSRDVDPDGAEVAQRLAEKAVELGRSVVSGAARGVDQLAMAAAYDAGGSVVGVLADSLQARIRKADVLAALDEGATCLITQQAPSAGFTAGAAMSRNKLIYALADVTVVVASAAKSGGTWAGAEEALRAGTSRVAVWRGPGEGPGNPELEDLGATPITTIDDLDALLDRQSTATHGPQQLTLGDTG
jgi:predicted Rossmann fold nucleotide-binding protein DprA/Smf involved in DNA uptake